MSDLIDNTELTQEEFNERLDEGLKKYKKLNFLERCSLYLGIVQILEIELKKLLAEKYEYEYENMKEWSLGKVYSELGVKNLRPDFLHILKITKDNRNYTAHEMVANRITTYSFFGKLTPENHYDKESRRLDKFIIELEQLLIVYDWINSNNGWI